MTLHLMPTSSDLAWQRRQHINAAAQVAEEVARKYGVSVSALKGPQRTRNVAHPRQEAMAEIRRLRPDLSLSQIGRFFNRDHTTVIHALRAVEKRESRT